MGIERIKIENYKSIKKCNLNLSQLNALIGENGCGKTNVISAIKYFYNNLISEMMTAKYLIKTIHIVTLSKQEQNMIVHI